MNGKHFFSLAVILVIILIVIKILSNTLTQLSNITDSVKSEVLRLVAMGIINDYDDKIFQPEKSITRAEFAAMLTRTLRLENRAIRAKGKTKFSDISESYWASGYINLLYTRGVIDELSDGLFRPDESITNEQAIKMILRAMQYGKKATALGGYPDGYIKVARDINLLKGLKSIQIKSNSPYATIVKMLSNALDIVPCYSTMTLQQIFDADYDNDTFWFLPAPFASHDGSSRSIKGMREDFISMMSDPDNNWSVIAKNANVFKTFININQTWSSGGAPKDHYTDEELALLAKTIKDRGMKTAFELGGLRPNANTAYNAWGEYTAEIEKAKLQRWINAGGRVDYITTDHAIMKTLERKAAEAGGKLPEKDLPELLAHSIEELADYFEIMQEFLPNVRLGVIESLGWFSITSDEGVFYKQNTGIIPNIDFMAFIDQLLEVMRRRNIIIDHFHTDFGVHAVDAEGGKKDNWIYGRIHACEKYVRSKGVNDGLIISPGRYGRTLFGEEGNQICYDLTIRYFNEYVKSGGMAASLIFSLWQEYPDITGPESVSLTTLGMIKDMCASNSYKIYLNRLKETLGK